MKSIGGFAFKNNKNLESVHLPENGCIIGHKDRWDAYGSIFSECISLKTITIPNGLDIIDGTYRGTYISALSAPNLENVIFSKGTSAICRGILANCPSLKSVDIPDSVKSIGAYAFSGCASLESVRLPKDGCEIGNNGLYGNYAPIFTGCDSLKHITIPDGLTTSNDHNSPRGAFAAPALESVTFASDVSAIDHGLLASCPSLKSVDIPDSVKSIGAFAFSGCEALESVRLPEGSCEIGSILNYYNESQLYGNVFQGCTSLTSLRLPKGITAISSENNYAWDYSMFSAPALKSVTFEDGTNTLFAHMFENCEALESVSIPNGVKTIPSYCFSNCKALASLDIPESVKTIESYAFKGCGFASIDLPDTVKAIHDRAFADCTSLSTVNLPTKGVELGGSYYPSNSNSGTFAGCTALKSIALPDGITGGMLGAPALTNVKFAPGIKKINGLGGAS